MGRLNSLFTGRWLTRLRNHKNAKRRLNEKLQQPSYEYSESSRIENWLPFEIGIIGTEKAIKKLRKAIKSEHVTQRENAIKGLRYIANNLREEHHKIAIQIIPPLVEALEDEKGLIRFEALTGLRTIANNVGTKYLEETVPALENLLKDPDENIRMKIGAAEILGLMGKDVSQMLAKEIQMLAKESEEGEDHYSRIHAAKLLGQIGRIGSEKAIQILVERAKEHKKYDIRAESLEALGEVGKDYETAIKIIPILKEAALKKNEKVGDRESAVVREGALIGLWSIARRQGPKVSNDIIPIQLEVLNAKLPEVSEKLKIEHALRDDAAVGLKALAEKELSGNVSSGIIKAIPTLIKIVKDPKEHIFTRSRSLEALEEIAAKLNLTDLEYYNPNPKDYNLKKQIYHNLKKQIDEGIEEAKRQGIKSGIGMVIYR